MEEGINKITTDEIVNLDGFDGCVNAYRELCRMDADAIHAISGVPFYKDNPNLIPLVVMHQGKCVGFCGLLKVFYPHLNKHVMVTESLFIQEEYRGKYWPPLLAKIKEETKHQECAGFIFSAQIGSKFEEYLKLKFKPLNALYWGSIHE